MWALVVVVNIKSFWYLLQRLSHKNYALDHKILSPCNFHQCVKRSTRAAIRHIAMVEIQLLSLIRQYLMNNTWFYFIYLITYPLFTIGNRVDNNFLKFLFNTTLLCVIFLILIYWDKKIKKIFIMILGIHKMIMHLCLLIFVYNKIWDVMH